MPKPRAQEALWVVQWEETYTSPYRGQGYYFPGPRRSSKKYKAERFARDHVKWLQQRAAWTGKNHSGWNVVPDSIKLWRAPVAEWEEVSLED